MNNWFETHVKYEKTLENGTRKRVDETYLVDALSFTEAENRTIEEMTPFISGEFEVSSAKRSRIAELFLDASGDKYYSANVCFITLDEKNGMEKRSYSNMLVQASDFQMAVKNLETGMKGTMSDWEIFSITETKIMDVFRVKSESKEAESN